MQRERENHIHIYIYIYIYTHHIICMHVYVARSWLACAKNGALSPQTKMPPPEARD